MCVPPLMHMQMYWFSVPEAGRIAASIPHGRQAILAAIKRSRYRADTGLLLRYPIIIIWGHNAKQPFGSTHYRHLFGIFHLSRYKEVLDKNVAKLRWGKSELTPAFHIADLVGAGEIVELSMSAGKFYRLNV